jgi:hypothetical protein
MSQIGDISGGLIDYGCPLPYNGIFQDPPKLGFKSLTTSMFNYNQRRGRLTEGRIENFGSPKFL